MSMKTIAIITGASSGLGKEFVKHLNIDHIQEIWAIDSQKEALESIKSDILTPIKYICLDLAKEESFDEIKKLLEKEKPSVKWLVNASDMCKFGSHNDLSVSKTIQMFNLSCKATMWMTELVIPYMPEFGRIVNVSSMLAFHPVQYLSTYAAAKAFVLSYSRAMRKELQAENISITCLCPIWMKFKEINLDVVYNYNYLKKTNKIVLKATKAAIKNKEICVYGARSAWYRFVSRIIPHRILMKHWSRKLQKYQIVKSKKQKED